MARYLYCEPCGEIACGGAAVTFSNGSGEDAERSAWGTLLATKMKVSDYSQTKAHKDRHGVVVYDSFVEKTTEQPVQTADLECNACGGMLAPGDKVCAYSLGTEPAWESRYLEIMDAA